jgi:LexA-binding, inner membrane-associated putative hydrolase
MPGYKGHLAGGVVTYAVGLYLLHSYCPSGFVAIQWLGCTLAGALFPDIDVKSKGQKYFYWVVLALFGLLIYQKQYRLLSVASIASVIPMLARHRGVFHKISFIIGLSFGTWLCVHMYVPSLSKMFLYFSLFFAAGALSHIMLDFGPKRFLSQI